MKILVLGAKSFTGSWFAEVASAAGHEVVGLNRPEWDLKEQRSAALEDALGAGYKRVINFAAANVVPASWDKATDYYEANVVGIARLASWLLGRVERFVQVSTPEVYGSTEIENSHGLPIRETWRQNPSTPYAVSRAAADAHLRLMHREFGFPVCFTRTVNVYGERQQLYRIVPKTMVLALTGRKLPLEGGGVTPRSFLHAADVAAAALRVLEDGKPGEIYHAANENEITIRDLVRWICLLLQKRFEDVAEDAPERRGKDFAYRLDDAKIRTELGWVQKIPLVDGLSRTLNWVRSELPRLAEMPTEYKHR